MDAEKSSDQATSKGHPAKLTVALPRRITFLDLPLEVRLLIYSYLVSNIKRVHLIEAKEGDNSVVRCTLPGPVFLVSKQVRAEAAMALIGSCEYRMWYETMRKVDVTLGFECPWFFDKIQTLVLRCDAVRHPRRVFDSSKLAFLIAMPKLGHLTIDYRAMPDIEILRGWRGHYMDYCNRKMRAYFEELMLSHDQVGAHVKMIPTRKYKLYVAFYFHVENVYSTRRNPSFTRLQAKFDLDTDELITSVFIQPSEARGNPSSMGKLSMIGPKFRIGV